MNTATLSLLAPTVSAAALHTAPEGRSVSHCVLSCHTFIGEKHHIVVMLLSHVPTLLCVLCSDSSHSATALLC